MGLDGDYLSMVIRTTSASCYGKDFPDILFARTFATYEQSIVPEG